MKTRTLFGSILITLLCTIAFVSCSKDDNDDEGGGSNSGKLATTGSVIDFGDTWAEVDGFVNNTDKDGNMTDVKEYGVEYGLADGSGTAKNKKGQGLKDGKFSVKLESLTPNTKYRFRTYVIPKNTEDPATQYGSYKTFTTEKAEEATNYVEGGITYEVKSESSKTAMVTKIEDSVKDADILNTVTIKGKEYKVVELCENVGKSHNNLKSITMLSNLTTIGNKAFYGCENLSNLEIGENVTTIGDYAFSGCNSLTSVNVPNKVKQLNTGTFSSCAKLKTATIGNGVTSIGEESFKWCAELASVKLSQNLLTIGKAAFYNCTKLGTISFPSSLVEIGDEAFSECTTLNNITLPANLSSIGEWAFYNCTSLNKLTVNENLTKIGFLAFSHCNLSTFTVPSSCTDLGNSILTNNFNLTSCTIKSSISKIPSAMFGGCHSLKSIDIPTSVRKIESRAFEYCKELTKVLVPSKVTEIEIEAFSGCTKLKTVQAGDPTNGCNLQSIQRNVFKDCPNIQAVECYAKTPPKLNGSFETTVYGNCKWVKVPSASLKAYQNDDEWKQFKYLSAMSSY